MTNYSHIKLTTGEDLVGTLVDLQDGNADNIIAIHKPVKIIIDPVEGVMCKVWNSLSQGDVVVISRNNIMYVMPSSERAADYYNQFINMIEGRVEPDEDDWIDEDLCESEEIVDALSELYASKAKIH